MKLVCAQLWCPKDSCWAQDSGGDRASSWWGNWDGTWTHPSAGRWPWPPSWYLLPRRSSPGHLCAGLLFSPPPASSSVSGSGEWGSPGVRALPPSISYHPLTLKTVPDSDQEGVRALHWFLYQTSHLLTSRSWLVIRETWIEKAEDLFAASPWWIHVSSVPSSPRSHPEHQNARQIDRDGAWPYLHGGDRAVRRPTEGRCSPLALVVYFSVCLRWDKAEQINSAGSNQELSINMPNFHWPEKNVYLVQGCSSYITLFKQILFSMKAV